jgi:hypothetical protein
MCTFSLGDYGEKGEAKSDDFLKLKIYLKLYQNYIMDYMIYLIDYDHQIKKA